MNRISLGSESPFTPEQTTEPLRRVPGRVQTRTRRRLGLCVKRTSINQYCCGETTMSQNAKRTYRTRRGCLSPFGPLGPFRPLCPFLPKGRSGKMLTFPLQVLLKANSAHHPTTNPQPKNTLVYKKTHSLYVSAIPQNQKVCRTAPKENSPFRSRPTPFPPQVATSPCRHLAPPKNVDFPGRKNVHNPHQTRIVPRVFALYRET